MNLIVLKNISIRGGCAKPCLVDVFFRDDASPKPIVIFSHGFKGFKDWGHFNVLAKRFAEEGFVFIKFNFSHNGTTAEDPEKISDLVAFGNNNYTIELGDLRNVVDWALKAPEISRNCDPRRLFLLGHSRGGGISILMAGEDKRIKKLVTWGSVADFIGRNKKRTIETWKKDGVVYTENKRTGQKLPLYYQFYEEIQANKERFNINKALHRLTIPVLVIHGTADEAVPVQEAEQIRRAAPHAQLVLIEGAGHTFGIKHPFEEGPFPGDAELAIFKTLEFLKDPATEYEQH